MTYSDRNHLLALGALASLLLASPTLGYHWFNDPGTGPAAGTFVFSHWPSMPIPYIVDNEALPAGITFAGNVEPAFNAWENVPTSTVDFQQNANTTGITNFTWSRSAANPSATSPNWCLATDSRNEVAWLHNSDLGAGLFGVGLTTVDTTTGEIQDFCMLINIDASGGTDPTLRGVVTHELGHVLGIGHTAVGNPDFTFFPVAQARRPTMFPYAQAGDGNRLESLELDDILIVSRIYPETVDAPPTRVPFSLTQQKISGRVVKGTDGSTARGVYVRLVSVADTGLQTAVLSDFLGQGDGKWDLPGLPTGSWYVVIDPLPSSGTIFPDWIEDDGVGSSSHTYTGFPREHFDAAESNHDTATDKVALPVWSTWNTGNVNLVTNEGTRPDPAITPWGADLAPPAPPYWQTPDIWVDNDADGVVNEPHEPERGRSNNKLTARVTNRGNAAASGYKVDFAFRAYTTSAHAPEVAIGSVTESGTLIAGASRTYTVDWDLTNAFIHGNFDPQFWSADHFCVRVRIHSSGSGSLNDANPHNNFAQNNFANVPLSPGGLTQIRFFVYNHLDRTAIASLEWAARIDDDRFQVAFPGLADPSRIVLQPRQALEVTAELAAPVDAPDPRPEWPRVRGLGRDEPVLFDLTQRLDGEVVGGLTVGLQPAASQQARFYLGIFGGIDEPTGSTANLYHRGPFFGLRVERGLGSEFRLGLEAAHHTFDDEPAAGVGDLDVTRLSFIGRRFFGSTSVRPFGLLGLGAYRADGSWDAGGQLGLGVEVPLTPKLWWTLGADGHLVNRSGPLGDLHWVDAYVGLSFAIH